MSQTTKKFDIGIISLREIGMKINTEELHKINPNNLEVSFGMRLCKEKENELILRLGRMIRNSALIFLACVILCIWGWSGMIDPMLPNISEGVRTVVKWVALIGAIISGVFTILAFLSHRNGKKSLLAKIDRFQGKD